MANERAAADQTLSKRERERFDAKIVKTDGCWNWTAAVGAGGYGVFKLRGKSRTAHRLALVEATGRNPPDLQAAHGCNNVLCCNPAHLRWATHQENQDDKKRPPHPFPKNTQAQESAQ